MTDEEKTVYRHSQVCRKCGKLARLKIKRISEKKAEVTCSICGGKTTVDWRNRRSRPVKRRV